MKVLEKGTIFLSHRDQELGKLMYDVYYPSNRPGFHTNNGWIPRKEIKSIFVRE